MTCKSNFHVAIFHRYFAFLFLLGAIALSPHLARAQGKSIRIDFSPQIDDYAPVIQKSLNDLYDAGGGTLDIAYGRYPFKTEMMLNRNDHKTVDITIRGIKNPAGERPEVYCVADPGQTHRMLVFQSGYLPESSMGISLSSIEVVGNNVPVNRVATNVPGDDGVSMPWVKIPFSNQPENLNYGHPFMFHAGFDGDGIRGNNLRTMRVDDAVIREIYGNGIVVANYGARIDQRSESPSVTNTRVINTWQWQDGFMTGDGIIMYFANKPRVENCVVYNDISYTHWIGRIGVTIENDCAGAVIRNNIIGGYNSDIHIELTFGGHQVTGNQLLAAVTAVTLNEATRAETDWDYAAYTSDVKPDSIRDNIMEYGFERQKYITIGYGGRRALVDLFRPDGYFQGTEISRNKMTIRLLEGMAPAQIYAGNYISQNNEVDVRGLNVHDNQYLIEEANGNTIPFQGVMNLK